MRRCSGCGATVAKGENVCQACGRPVAKKNRVWIFLLVFGCVLVLAAAGVYGQKVSRDNQFQEQLSLGYKYLLDGAYVQAEQAFSKALELDENSIEAQLGLAKSFVAQEKYSEAEAIAKEIIKGDTANQDALGLMITICIGRGDIAGAFAALEQGEDAAGKDAFAAIRNGIEEKIKIQAEELEADVSQPVRVRLVYASDSLILLAPEWSILGSGEWTARADGSADITATDPGELKVTASFASVTRETTIVFTKKEKDQFSQGLQEAVDILEQLTYPFGIRVFEEPNDLPDEAIIWLMLSWIDRSSGGLDSISAQQVEDAAQRIFGPDLRGLVHTELDLAEWNPETLEYQIIGMGLDAVSKAFVIDAEEASTKYIVDVVHLILWQDWEDDEDEMDVYDEEDNHLGRFKYDELDSVLTDDYLNTLPKRRYEFSKQADGRFFLTKSYKLR